MPRKKRTPEAQRGTPLYMTTYGDMATLILCFFILLFAMSSIDSMKFEKALVSLKGSLGILTGGVTTESSPEPSQSGEKEKNAGSAERYELDTQHIAHTVDTYISSQKGLNAFMQVTVNQRGVEVSISDQFLFDGGSAELKSDGKRALYKIADLVRAQVPAVSVEGHTDSLPLKGGVYRDNWGLSSARAAVVASYLEGSCGFNPLKLQAVGYASSHPLVPNDSSEHRALNRRVDLVFLSQYPKR